MIFDQTTIRDHATLEIPSQLFAGFDFVFVNFVFVHGVPVIEKGKIAVFPGKLLRGPGHAGPDMCPEAPQ